ncbi:DEAD/DEAH box helicase [Kribbella sp. NPDC006257]|uniref:DEAD/DEAH box helicase n=1 Tax=Kribbella sp. NPDC006257 TaxID=3156738 RepID=UPI0033B50054
MSQHYQDQFVPADGNEAADRAKKPRHKKFQTQSYGERMAAELDAPSTPGTERSSARVEKPAQVERRGGPSQYSDRGSRGPDRRDNDRRGSDNRSSDNRGDRPVRGYRAAERTERPARTESTSYPKSSYQGNSYSKPSFGQRTDRDSRGFDRPADRDGRGFDRPERSTSYPRSSDRPERTGGYQGNNERGSSYPRSNDRPERTSYPRSSDRPERSSYQGGGDRPERSGGYQGSNDRPERSSSYQRSDDRPARSSYQGNNERGSSYPRSNDRPERSNYRGNDRNDRGFQRDPDRDYERVRPERVELPEDLGEVAEGNGFSAIGIAPRLVQRLARDGITAPFPIQEATIPDALAGKDVLGRGQTGSGKTLGFGLPTLMRLAGGHTESRRPRGMVLVPTRELAMQVHDALEPLAHVMGVSIKLIAGGLPYPKQIESLRRGVDLLIATPGRLIDLCEQGAADLGAVEVAVLDEADHMCDMGFMPAVTTLLDMTPTTGQRLLFSATLDNDVDTIVKTYLKDPVTHSTESGQASVSTMEHHLLVIEPAHKQSLTAELASRDGRTIVFVRTKLGADRVATQLRDRGVMAAALHGGLTQGARNRTLDQFKDGSVPVLVATDVAARGIHVDDVGLVVQADPAADHKDYLHRAGRTARAGGKGAVVTLVLPHQRRGMMRLAESAGVVTEPVRVRPGDENVAELTGGTKPSGYPVKLPAPKPQRGGGGFNKGGKRFGGGGSRPSGRGYEGRSGGGGGYKGRSDRGNGRTFEVR